MGAFSKVNCCQGGVRNGVTGVLSGFRIPCCPIANGPKRTEFLLWAYAHINVGYLHLVHMIYTTAHSVQPIYVAFIGDGQCGFSWQWAERVSTLAMRYQKWARSPGISSEMGD